MASIPDTRLPLVRSGGAIVPQFLTEVDHPWLRILLEERARFVGRRQRELDVRLREPIPCLAPPRKLALAVQTLHGAGLTRISAAVPPRNARKAVFEEAARARLGVHDGAPAAPRAEILETAAASLAVTPSVLEACLFADLPGEQIVSDLAKIETPSDLALLSNQALARSLLARSTRVRVELAGRTRPVIRYAKLRGLIVGVSSAGTPEGGVTLDVSGPLSLFRRTCLYGRAIADLLPVLAWCGRFRLAAEVELRSGPGTFVISTGAPIFPSREPALFDSKLEARFARDFGKASTLWDLQREPEPFPLRAQREGLPTGAAPFPRGTALIFPDFALQHRLDPSRRWLLEIVGFWTPSYLSEKLARFRAAGIENLILCVDAQRNCAASDFPTNARVIRYQRRIDPATVLAIIDPADAG